MQKLQCLLNALVILIISGVLLSAYCVEFFWHETPCPLCMLQRVAMIGAAIGFCFNLFFGVKMAHYGFSLLASIVGGAVALRQISLHVCPGTVPFGFPVLGLSLYTWSFIVFVCVILSIAGLSFLYDPLREEANTYTPKKMVKLTWALLLIVTASNAITTFIHCGFGPCAD